MKVDEIITILKQRNESLSMMESCTGGQLSSEITNVEGSSDVFELGIVAYSNKFKVKFGVDNEILQTYSVYSIQIAQEMAKSISLLANSSWGIGVTGQIGRADPKNEGHIKNQIYYSIYNKQYNKYYSYYINLHEKDSRITKKQQIIQEIIKKFKEILINEK